MSNYAKNNLTKNEILVKKASLNPISLVFRWIAGVLLIWMLFIPTVKAIIATCRFFSTELAITDKRVIGKIGVLNTKSLDAPLNKIQNTSVEQKFLGKIFNYATVRIDTAAGNFTFDGIMRADEFKRALMAQVDEYEDALVKRQATEMASAMSAALKNSAN